jgi:hypothetical protein
MPQTSSSHSDLSQLASQGDKYLNKPWDVLDLCVFCNNLLSGDLK